VAIAKILAQEPTLILGDEPVASLDVMNGALVMEIVVEEPLLLGRHLLGPHKADALRGEDGPQLLEEAAMLRVDQSAKLVGDGGQRLAGGESVRARARVAGADAPHQLGDADHEEPVEIRAEDGEELPPLEQRHGGVLAPPARGG
jgi:hypothetical protein